MNQQTATVGPNRDLVGYGPRPPKVYWPEGRAVAVNIVVNQEEGSEYSFGDGDDRHEVMAEIPYTMPAGYRDLDVESVFEYGSRAGFWRLFRLFREYKIQSTVYACALAVERNPETGTWIREGGHEVCCHGWRWEEPWLLSREEEREHMLMAIASLQRTCGERPVGWFCRYAPSVNTRELLVEEGGFLYDSDAFNDDLPYFTTVNGKEHLIIPYTHVQNDGRYVLSPGYGSPADFFEVCKRALDELLREGRAGYPKMMSIGLHPRWAGQPSRTAAVRQFLEYALATNDVWFARRVDIANWWITHYEDFDR